MTTKTAREEKREVERTLIRKAKKQRRNQRTEDAQVLLLSVAYDEEVRNTETGEWETEEKTLDVFVPRLKDVTEQEMTRVIRTARKMGDDAAMDLMLETFLGEDTYEFLLYEVDSETFKFVAEKVAAYLFGTEKKENATPEEVEEGKA